MNRESQPRRLVPSLIDRLIDEDINAERDPIESPLETQARLFEALQRDLVNLLNTRCRRRDLDDENEDRRLTLLDFGLPEHAGVNSIQPEEFRRYVEESIRAFEPRLRDVKVHVLDTEFRVLGETRCRISALVGESVRTFTISLPTEVQAGTVEAPGVRR